MSDPRLKQWRQEAEREKHWFSIGSIVRGRLSGYTYIITDTINGLPVATRTISITWPDDWDLISEPEED